MAKKAGTKLKYAPITNQVLKAQIKAYWKTEKAKKRAELDEANEKAKIAAMAKHPLLFKPMKPRVMRKHNDIIAQKEKKSAKVSTL